MNVQRLTCVSDEYPLTGIKHVAKSTVHRSDDDDATAELDIVSWPLVPVSQKDKNVHVCMYVCLRALYTPFCIVVCYTPPTCTRD